MPILIGTDEAGYGPNLGPLVVAATAWKVPAGLAPADLFARLGDVVRTLPESSARADVRLADRLPIADSKLLYQPGGGLAALERGVLAALSVLDARGTIDAAGAPGATEPPAVIRPLPASDLPPRSTAPACWRDVFQSLAPDFAPALLIAPWFRNYDCAVPVDLSVAERLEWSRRLQVGLEQADVRLLDLRAATIGPEDFNREVRRRGSKGSLLTDTTLALVVRLLDDVAATSGEMIPADEPCLVVCDKHGGRNHYMGPLQHAFPDCRMDVMAEGRESSRYRFVYRRRRVTIEFRARGEQLLPAALASMTAKYLRELAMRAFNAFWIAQVPGLEPTAGYPVDARRFLNDIRAAQTLLKVPDDILWREK